MDDDDDLFEDEARAQQILDLTRSFFEDRRALLQRFAELSASRGNQEAAARYTERALRLTNHMRTWPTTAA